MNHFHGLSNFGDFNFIILWQRFLDRRSTLLRVCVKPSAGTLQYCGPLGFPQLAELTFCSQINYFRVLSLYTPSSCTEFHWVWFHTWVRACSHTTKHWWRILKVIKQWMQRSITGHRRDGLTLKCQYHPKKDTDYCLCSLGMEKDKY